KLFEGTAPNLLLDTGLSPIIGLSGGVIYMVPPAKSGGQTYYRVSAKVDGRAITSAVVTASGTSVPTLSMLQPVTSTLGVSRSVTFRWDRDPNASTYLLIVSHPHH